MIFSAYRSALIMSLALQDPHHSHREVSFGRQPLGEVVEGVWLSADWVAVTMDLVEQVS